MTGRMAILVGLLLTCAAAPADNAGEAGLEAARHHGTERRGWGPPSPRWIPAAAALAELMARRTTLMIAHRFSTIENADRILVLHRGRIIESGSHEALMDARGFYARMVQLQK